MKKKDQLEVGIPQAEPNALALALELATCDRMALAPPLDNRKQRHAQRLRMITELTGADAARIRALASAFVKANETDLQHLRQLRDKGDRLGLRQLAHRIKGAAQMTGDTQLIALCTELSLSCASPKGTAFALDTCIQNIDLAMREFGESCQRMADDAAAPPP